MRLEDIRRSIASFMEEAFVPREVFFRSGDRFHHFRFSIRAQKATAASAVAVLIWGLYASGSFVANQFIQAAKDREIAEHKLAYLDLLTEVGEYHTQFTRITTDLEDNQAYLLSLLEQTPRNRKSLTEIQKRLKNSENEHARVVLAREGLRAKMEQFEKELLEIAGKNISLQSQLAQVQDHLKNSRAEREEVEAARERLVHNLSTVEREVANLGSAKQDLETTIAELRQNLNASESARKELVDDKTLLNQRVGKLTRSLDSALQRQAELKDRIGTLDQSLAKAETETKELETTRETLQRRVGGLEQRLIVLRDAEQDVIERLNERTRLTVDVMEKTVAMTGLNVDKMVGKSGRTQLGQGGPFVPASDETAAFEPSDQLGNTVSLLDEQLDRWSALQKVLAALPLTAPLDQYRISSGYGERRDPVNGRKARHHGVDFAAPTRTSVYTTAPGKVVSAGWQGRYGRTIEIDHGHGVRTRYSHLRKILVKPGQEVDHREKIGLVGSSGRSTGPHVHYEVRYRGRVHNPMKFLKAGKYVFKG